MFLRAERSVAGGIGITALLTKDVRLPRGVQTAAEAGTLQGELISVEYCRLRIAPQHITRTIVQRIVDARIHTH